MCLMGNPIVFMCFCGVCSRRTYFDDVFDGKNDSVYVYVFLWGVQAGGRNRAVTPGAGHVHHFPCLRHHPTQQPADHHRRLCGRVTGTRRWGEYIAAAHAGLHFPLGNVCLFFSSVWLWGVFFFISLLVSAGSFTVFCWSWWVEVTSARLLSGVCDMSYRPSMVRAMLLVPCSVDICWMVHAGKDVSLHFLYWWAWAFCACLNQRASFVHFPFNRTHWLC